MAKVQRRFYKAKLPAVVWDKDNDRVLARFEQGQHTTSDPRVAEILEGMGYPEVSLKAKQPPPLPEEPLQPAVSEDVKIMGGQVTEQAVLDKHKREAMLDNEKETTTDSDAGQPQEKSKRSIKRRDKE